MGNYKIIKIQKHEELIGQASEWFHEKWGIPKDVYMESMRECARQRSVESRECAGQRSGDSGECARQSSAVPQWYVMMDARTIIAGAGVIANDFHDRKDLTPNVCAVFVEEAYRCQGIAGEMLHFICEDMKERGIQTLYLVTDHTSFYERYGWKFLCMVQGDGETEMSRMYVHEDAASAGMR